VSEALRHIGSKRPFCVPDHKICYKTMKYQFRYRLEIMMLQVHIKTTMIKEI